MHRVVGLIRGSQKSGRGRSASSYSPIRSAVAAGLLFAVASCEVSTGSLTEPILDTNGTTTPFAKILPDREWDTVCYLDPYASSSLALAKYLGPDLDDFDYWPSDRWIGEEENGITFVDRRSKIVYVYALSRRDIREIVGPRCLQKSAAFFRLDLIQARNITYKQLSTMKYVDQGE